MIGINRMLRKLPHNAHGQRWGILTMMRVPNLDGSPYLTRLRFVQTPLFGVYLHWIHTEDWDRHLHDHPWRFTSFVLSGGYCEKLAARPEGTVLGLPENIWRTQGSIHRFPKHGAHTIIHVRPNTRTLVFVGRRRGSWGFFVPGEGWVQNGEYLKRTAHPWNATDAA